MVAEFKGRYNYRLDKKKVVFTCIRCGKNFISDAPPRKCDSCHNEDSIVLNTNFKVLQ